jgi:hypothetical protein
MARVSPLSAFYTSSAITGALTHRWLQILILAYGIFELCVFFDNVGTLGSVGMAQASKFRFFTTELRGGGQPVSSGVEEFGLLLDGCKVPRTAYNVSVDGAAVTLSFPKPQQMNGWWLKTLPATPEKDALRFTVEATNDGKLWNRVDVSEATNHALKMLLVVMPWRPTIFERSAEQTFDLRTSWQIQTYMHGDSLITTFTCFVCAMFAMRGHYVWAKMAGAIGLILIGLFGIACGAASVASGLVLESVDSWLRCPILVFSGAALACGEKHVVLGMILFGSWHVLVPRLQGLIYYGAPKMIRYSFAGMIITCVGMLIFFSRQLILFLSKRRVAYDMKAYNRAWKSVLSRPGTRDALGKLSKICRNAIRRREKGWVIRQCNRRGDVCVAGKKTSGGGRCMPPVKQRQIWPVGSDSEHEHALSSCADCCSCAQVNHGLRRASEHQRMVTCTPCAVCCGSPTQTSSGTCDLDTAWPVMSLDQVLLCDRITCVRAYLYTHVIRVSVMSLDQVSIWLWKTHVYVFFCACACV